MESNLGRWGLRGICLWSALLLATLSLQACSNDDDGGGTSQGEESCLFTLANPDPPEPVEVASFARNPDDGTIDFVGRFETGGLGDSFVGGTNQGSIAAQGRTLYAVSPGPNPDYEGTANEGQGSITAFDIEDDCSLEAKGIVPSGGMLPVSIAVQGDLLYVANQGNVPLFPPLEQGSYSGFRINGDGTLDPIDGSTVIVEPIEPEGNNPAQILLNEDGSILVGVRLTGNGIDTFRINNDGQPTDAQSIDAGGGPFGSSFSPADPSLLLVTIAEPMLNRPDDPQTNLAPGLTSFRLDDDGDLTRIDSFTGPGDPDVVDPCWTAITDDGEHIWTSSFIPRALNAFSIDGGGDVDRLSVFNPEDVEEETGKILGSIDIALSPDQNYLYQLRAFDVDFLLDPDNAVFIVPQIHVLRVTGNFGTDGGLELVEAVQLPEDQDDDGSMGLLVVDLD